MTEQEKAELTALRMERDMRKMAEARNVELIRERDEALGQLEKMKFLAVPDGWKPMPVAAARDVLAERARQVSQEGWTLKHDDQHSNGEMAIAGSCYALHAHDPDSHKRCIGPTNWPWLYSWWKPTTPRRDLVKAGALILAEIERLDRADLDSGKEGGPYD